MASKILVIGDVDGQFEAVFTKVAVLHAKNKFAFALVAGNLFRDPAVYDDDNDSALHALVSGRTDVPLTTYFALGSRPLPPVVLGKLQSSDDELCSNLFFLGKRSVTKTSEGIRIVALGGSLDPNIIGGSSKDKYMSLYSDTDAKILKGATSADILITSEWPAGIRNRSKVEFNPNDHPKAHDCISELCATLKPRYHFSTSGDAFYEREPFFHTPSEETDGLYPTTRFISLASFGNPDKQKWIYAFSLDPAASHPVTALAGSTASPLLLPDKKRAAPTESSLVYEDNSRGRGAHKRRKGEHRGPVSASECFFCLSNKHVAAHLVSSIAESSYMTTAKGPLSTPATFPRLGFPGHLLIIPVAHKPTLAQIEEEERHATYTEMQRYRSSLNAMLKSVAEEEYGSVTWELSKQSLPHTHWQWIPVPADLIKKGLVEAAFKALAENLHYPGFKKQDVGDGFEESSDFFRILIWHPDQPEKQQTSLILRFDESIRFHMQFGREVLAKLMRLDQRIDWHNCGQTQEEEEADVAAFKVAYQSFDIEK
ncbi:hypothetical protein EJ04DRAFT_537033 [Polyplosphaeria fusca]|uniref:Uncharacterized protein n=1 Tax=Polyplosphaeria fusca TaxID=682080 RepID=A0A9P4QSC7_9PLEO|nr:hypothetical protein EJ04DRAFT_537033 [Polyplosphaeria fusca]